MESREVSQAVAAIYEAPPGAFISARDELVKDLRSRGDREAAGEVAKLRRPTVAAWVVNVLAADQPELAAQLGELAEQLREAQDQLSGDDLRALGRQRHQLVAGLVARARQLAKAAGRPVNADVLGEVESTLRAALADPLVAEQVLSGRLTHPIAAEGFGLQPPSERPPAPPRPQKKADEGRRAAELRKAERELEKAEDALRAAEEEQSRADEDAARAAEIVTAADERVSWLRAQLEQATAELVEARAGEEKARQRARVRAGAVADARERAEGARARADLS